MSRKNQEKLTEQMTIEPKDTAHAMLVLGCSLLILCGLPLLLFATLVFVFSWGGGWDSRPDNSSGGIAAAIILLAAGINCVAQGVATLRSTSKLVERRGPMLLFGIVQLPLLLIGLTFLNGHHLLTDLFGSNEGRIVSVLFNSSVVVSALSSLGLWIVLLLQPVSLDKDKVG